MAGIAATGGSTNGVLHLLAIAQEARVPLTLEELTGVSSRTPVIANLAPSGTGWRRDFHRAGGSAAVIRELVRGGHVDGEAPTVEGKNARGPRQWTRRSRTAKSSTHWSRPFKPTGALHALRGNLAPEGSLVKHPGRRAAPIRPSAGVRERGGLQRRRAGGPCQERRRARRALTRGPRAGRGCARC